MTVKVQDRAAALKKEIGEARNLGIEHGKRKFTEVAADLNKIAAIAVVAVSDPELGVEERKEIVRTCAEAVSAVGDAGRSFGPVKDGVCRAAAIMREAVKGTGLLTDAALAGALDGMESSVRIGRLRLWKEGGVGPKTKAGDREWVAATHLYGAFCKENGKPTERESIPDVIGWIEFRIGRLTHDGNREALEKYILRDMEGETQL